MIQFKKEGINDFFSLNIKDFNKEDYILTLQSLLFFVKYYNTGIGECAKETYHVCTLIEAMLPDSNQLINADERALFEQFKKERK